jgi:hypothetical protein
MKTTLNILKIFCTLLVISVFIDFIKKLSHVFYYFFNGGEKSKLFNIQIPENWDDGVYYFLLSISLALIIYITLLAVDFRQVIFNFSKDKVFTKENSKQLRRIGKGLIIYAIIIISLDVILGTIAIDWLNQSLEINSSNSSYSSGYKFGRIIGSAISNRLPMFLVALFVQFISFIVVKGNEIQEENNLTI